MRARHSEESGALRASVTIRAVSGAVRQQSGEFQREIACPSTGATSGHGPGYVVDHIVSLKRGGVDEPANMQWRTTAEARAKDGIE